MTNKELLEKIAEAINDSTESIYVLKCYFSNPNDTYESKVEIINPELLQLSLRNLADSL